MRQNLTDEIKISWQIGDATTLNQMQTARALKPFDERIVEFLSAVSRKLLSDPEAKAYPDVVTFAF